MHPDERPRIAVVPDVAEPQDRTPSGVDSRSNVLQITGFDPANLNPRQCRAVGSIDRVQVRAIGRVVVQPQDVRMHLRSGDATNFHETVVAETANNLRFTGMHIVRKEEGSEKQNNDRAENHAAKTTPAIAARTTALTREISTSNVTKRRTPEFMDVLYVARMVRWFATDTATLPITVGTVLWALAALIVFLTSGANAWLWVCVVGFVCGLGGLLYLRLRAQRPGVRYE